MSAGSRTVGGFGGTIVVVVAGVLVVAGIVSAVARLYPQALRQTRLVGAWNGYWLVTRSACAQTGRWGYPALLARVRQGRVTALVASGRVCDVS